jgi:hypothetical protein
MGSLQDAPFVQKQAENVSTTNDKAVKITYTSSVDFLNTTLTPYILNRCDDFRVIDPVT